MTVLKLVGASRFMHKKACPNVIEKGNLTPNIKDSKLADHLLSMTWRDTLHNEHPMFEKVAATKKKAKTKAVSNDPISDANKQNTEAKEEVQSPTEQPVQKVARKKSTRTRKKA